MRVGFIEERGRRVALLDFSDLDAKGALAQIEEARRFFQLQPQRREILTLLDLRCMSYDDGVVRAFQELTRHDEPWERAVAVCGLGPLGLVAFRATDLLTGSRLRAFPTRAEGVAWLLRQGRAAA